MQFLTGKIPYWSTKTGETPDFKLMDENPPASEQTGTRQPCRATLKWMARSCIGRVAGHPLVKGVAGPMIALGSRIDCLGLDNDWFGDWAPIVAAGGACLFVISTIISTYNKPRFEPIVKHLSQSVGYGVAGIPLALIQFSIYMCSRKSLQEFDAEQIKQQIAPEWDPVMDGHDFGYDTQKYGDPDMDMTTAPTKLIPDIENRTLSDPWGTST